MVSPLLVLCNTEILILKHFIHLSIFQIKHLLSLLCLHNYVTDLLSLFKIRPQSTPTVVHKTITLFNINMQITAENRIQWNKKNEANVSMAIQKGL